jgi:hypothetical protein
LSSAARGDSFYFSGLDPVQRTRLVPEVGPGPGEGGQLGKAARGWRFISEVSLVSSRSGRISRVHAGHEPGEG